MVPVTVANLSISKVGFVVLLKSQKDERTLPIYIGLPEAQSILFQLNKVKIPRPMTHDLMKNVLDVLEARLERVDVVDLKEGTFFARLIVSFEGQTLEVDSRPSDAIALALRCNTPIFVAGRIMQEEGVILTDEDQGKKSDKTAEAKAKDGGDAQAKPGVAGVIKEDPVAALKAKLARAIQQERYEEAARLRDEIDRAQSSN